MTDKERRAHTLERFLRRAARLVRDGDEMLDDRSLWAVLNERSEKEWGEPIIDVNE